MESDLIKRVPILLLLFTLFVLPCSFAVNTVTHYAVQSGYYYGESGTYTWIDHCPLCGHRDCLLWNPKCTYEGEWTCAVCNADYDGTNGYDKAGHGARARLTKYYPEPEPTISKMETVQPEPTPWQKAHACFQTNEILF
jgi:hypothetical protein